MHFLGVCVDAGEQEQQQQLKSFQGHDSSHKRIHNCFRSARLDRGTETAFAQRTISSVGLKCGLENELITPPEFSSPLAGMRFFVSLINGLQK